MIALIKSVADAGRWASKDSICKLGEFMIKNCKNAITLY